MIAPTADPWLAAARLGGALLVGAAIGYERERAGKPAGLRTLSLVAFGSSLFTLVALQLIEDWHGVSGVRLDPIRVVAGLMGGIGFLGAGAIIRDRASVEGITTAAAIWVAGALGLACGVGAVWLVLIGGAVTVGVLWLLGMLEHRLLRRDTDQAPPSPRGSG